MIGSLTTFPACCGIMVATGFSSKDPDQYTVESLRKRAGSYIKAILAVVPSRNQYSKVHKLLRQNGWKNISNPQGAHVNVEYKNPDNPTAGSVTLSALDYSNRIYILHLEPPAKLNSRGKPRKPPYKDKQP